MKKENEDDQMGKIMKEGKTKKRKYEDEQRREERQKGVKERSCG